MTRSVLCVLLLATSVARAEDAKPKAEDASKPKAAVAAKTQEKAKDEAQAAAKESPDLGMSILGNQEAPKALVIVPWKRSEIGDALGISPLLDDSRQPIDKEVFMRMLNYYDIRSETARPGGASSAGTGGRKK
jgi:hypothetical protein